MTVLNNKGQILIEALISIGALITLTTGLFLVITLSWVRVTAKNFLYDALICAEIYKSSNYCQAQLSKALSNSLILFKAKTILISLHKKQIEGSLLVEGPLELRLKIVDEIQRPLLQ